VFAATTARSGSGRRQQLVRRRNRMTSSTTSSGGPRPPGGRSRGDDIRSEHEHWLSEADYSCIQDERRAVPPPAVINARHTTSWAMYDGRPRLYTSYRCKWGYVARPPDATGNVYCRRGAWVGTLPFCQHVAVAAGENLQSAIPGAHTPPKYLGRLQLNIATCRRRYIS